MVPEYQIVFNLSMKRFIVTPILGFFDYKIETPVEIDSSANIFTMVLTKYGEDITGPKISGHVHAKAQKSGNAMLSLNNASGDRADIGVCDFTCCSFEKDVSPQVYDFYLFLKPLLSGLNKYPDATVYGGTSGPRG